MSIFGRSPNWNPADIPDLSFAGPTHSVDIGFLGGDQHRDAFVAIFHKMLADNRSSLEGLDLSELEARHTVSLTLQSGLSLPMPLLGLDAHTLARDLYDSHNEEIVLVLVGKDGRWRLGMRFDNPEFWFSAAAV
jgi:hypothetical protein